MAGNKEKVTPIVLTDEGATDSNQESLITGNYITTPDWVKALKYCLEQSKQGLAVSNREYSRKLFGNHYFRNHFSKSGELKNMGIFYGKRWRTCLKSKKRYKIYFILEESFSKAEKIIKRYYKTEE